MTFNIKYFIILALVFGVSHSQNVLIKIPEIETPEVAASNFQEYDPINNPIYLNGKVKTVKRVFKQHISIYRAAARYTQVYNYELNASKQIIDYQTQNVYSDDTIESLNTSTNFAPKKNGTITQDDTHYTFKNGLLVLQFQKTEAHKDSVVYKYNRRKKLEEIQHYTTYAIYDENATDETPIQYDKYELEYIEKATYDKQQKLLSVHTYFIGYKDIEYYKTTYSYNASQQLETYQRIFRQYNRKDTEEDEGFNLNNWHSKTAEILDYKPFSITSTFSYDRLGRIVDYTYVIVDNYGKKNPYESTNRTVKITYNDTLNTKIIASRISKKSSLGEAPRVRILRDEYSYDAQNNPVKILYYIIQKGKKILDKSDELSIDYF